ncbi:methyltransferase [Candidatus Woesearchaeota archaeon]|nr:methyltransferase [Candidatus Woesearchaeota archaeon]
MNSRLVFFSNFLKKPKEVASVSPSSRYVIDHIVNSIDFENANVVVEYGPGIGNTTIALLEGLKPDAKLICFETNKKFCAFLKENIHDPRLEVVNDTVENIESCLKKRGMKNIDYVVSGIPFSLMNKQSRLSIVKKTKNSLKNHGKFIVYQNSQHMKSYLNLYFKKTSVSLEFRNLPPTFIFVCEKT